MYAAVLHLHAAILHLYVDVLRVYAAILRVYVTILRVYADVLRVYAAILRVYADVVRVYAAILRVYVASLRSPRGLAPTRLGCGFELSGNTKSELRAIATSGRINSDNAAPNTRFSSGKLSVRLVAIAPSSDFV